MNIDWDIKCEESTLENFTSIFEPNYNYLTESFSTLGFIQPSAVQAESIPIGLKGKDIIVQSKSGTGKTITFLSLIFAKVKKMGGFQALVLTPTRELAHQIHTIFNNISKVLPEEKKLTALLSIGGLSKKDDESKMKMGYEVVIGTVGRTKLHIEEENFGTDRLRMIIIDEADILIKNKQFRKLFEDLRAIKSMRPVQFCLFSATFLRKNLIKFAKKIWPCKKILNSCDAGISHQNHKLNSILQKEVEEHENNDNKEKPFMIHKLSLSNLKQFYYPVAKTEQKSLSFSKMEAVVDILKNLNYRQCIIFYNDKGRGEQIIEELK